MADLFSKIKSQLDIITVFTYYTGRSVHKNKALCPWHLDNHESLYFKNNKFFKCFVCEVVKGSVIDFVMHYFNLTAWESAKKLNDDFNLGLMETDLTPQKRSEIQKVYAKQKEINTIIKIFDSWKESTERWFLNIFKIFWKIFINFAPQNFEEPSGIWLMVANHLEYMEYILEIFSSGIREEILQGYVAIESWKHRILKELEVF